MTSSAQSIEVAEMVVEGEQLNRLNARKWKPRLFFFLAAGTPLQIINALQFPSTQFRFDASDDDFDTL